MHLPPDSRARWDDDDNRTATISILSQIVEKLDFFTNKLVRESRLESADD